MLKGLTFSSNYTFNLQMAFIELDQTWLAVLLSQKVHIKCNDWI